MQATTNEKPSRQVKDLTTITRAALQTKTAKSPVLITEWERVDLEKKNDLGYNENIYTEVC